MLPLLHNLGLNHYGFTASARETPKSSAVTVIPQSNLCVAASICDKVCISLYAGSIPQVLTLESTGDASAGIWV